MESNLWLFAWENLVKLFFLFTPFFVLNMFLCLTEGATTTVRKKLAIKTTITVLITGTMIYFFGDALLKLFGLELDGFRIGAGILLLHMAVDLAMNNNVSNVQAPENVNDIVVVPLTIPTIMGPSCVSAIVIIGAEEVRRVPAEGIFHLLAGFAGLVCAMLLLGLLLYFAERLERIFGKKVIRIFSKLSGVILTAMASQMIVKGFCAFLEKSEVGAGIISAISKVAN